MTRRRKWITAIICVLVLLSLAAWAALSLVLPEIIRRQISSSLQAAGFEHVEFKLEQATLWSTRITSLSTGESGKLSVGSAVITYSPMDAINGKIESIKIEDGRLLIDLSPPDQPSPTTGPSPNTERESLPIQRIEAQSCVLVLKQGENQVEASIDGTLITPPAAASTLDAKASVGDATISATGSVDVGASRFSFDFTAAQLPLEKVVELLPESARGSISDMSGDANIKGQYTFADGSNAAGGTLDVAKLSVAGQDFADVHGKVAYEADKTRLSDVRFKWAGGSFTSEPVLIDQNSDAVALALTAEHLDLEQLLKIVLQDKATGTGSISGNVPVTIALNYISFGRGSVHSDAPGTLRLGGSTAALADVLDQTDPGFATDRNKQLVKQQILGALKDFQYDRLSAIFIPDEKGAVVSVSIVGQGRSGAKQPLDITLNFYGFERGLNAYLAGRSRVLELEK